MPLSQIIPLSPFNQEMWSLRHLGSEEDSLWSLPKGFKGSLFSDSKSESSHYGQSNHYLALLQHLFHKGPSLAPVHGAFPAISG